MRALAMTGMVTADWMPLTMAGSLMRATPPSRRMSAGTRSSAITAEAPASSAIVACSGSTTSMMTPPFSISARPRLTRNVPVSCTLTPRVYGPSPRRPSCIGPPRFGAEAHQSALQLPKSLDAVLEGRVGVEQPVEAGQLALLRVGRHRLLDPEVGRRPGVGVDDGLVVLQLLERGDEPRRVAGQLDAGHVGQRLAPAAHGELHELGDER